MPSVWQSSLDQIKSRLRGHRGEAGEVFFQQCPAQYKRNIDIAVNESWAGLKLFNPLPFVDTPKKPKS